jgi:Concanavalin A-like lectin/glucanases superfamily/Chondroitinase B
MALSSSLEGSIASGAAAQAYVATAIRLAGGPPLAYWRLASTDSVLDEMGTRNGIWKTAGGSLVAGLPQGSDGAVDFQAVATAEIPHDAGLQLSAFTLSFWFRLPTLPSEDTVWHLFSKELSGFNTGDFFVRVDSGGGLTINFQSVGPNTNHTINTTVEPETTYHLCVRADGSGFDAYLNGQSLGKNTAFTGAWVSNANALGFAAAPFSAGPANVVMDEVALYPRVLTEAEILLLAQHAADLPVATDDVATVPESATTPIDVLSNDTFVGAPAIQVMSQPGGGDSAAVSGQEINYTAGAVSSNTARSFTYRITDPNGTSNTATVSVTVLNSGVQPTSNANCYAESTADTVVVSSMAALESAVNAAPPGRNILIAPGTYSSGALTFNRNGTAANPIVVRPQNGIGTVTINGARWTLANTSSRLVFSKLFFNNGRIIMNGDHNRITRCRWRQFEGARAVQMNTARDCRVDHCDFSDLVDNGTKKNIIAWDVNGFDNGTNVRNLVDYCYIHDLIQATDLGNGQEILRFTAQPQNMDEGPAGDVCVVDHCLFSNIDVEGEAELVSIKSGGWAFRFCTFVNTDFYQQFRTGDNGEIRSCWFEGTRNPTFNIFGRNHLFIGNRCIGGLNVRVGAGSSTSELIIAGADPIGSYARSENCRIIGNRMGSGFLQVGGYWSGTPVFPALNNNLHENTRDSGGDAFTLVSGALSEGGQRHSGTTFSIDNESYTPAVKLTASDVGLESPDPLCPSGPQS